MKPILLTLALALASDDRAADVAAIRAHIESIFQAFIDKDVRALEATHGTEWRGLMPGSPEPIRGRDGYMPPELITVGFGPGGFGTRELVVAGARDFAASGAKLTRLLFPRTEFQAYGSTVILYTSYETDVTKDGRTRTERGLATEVFVQQDGRWLNTAWQLSPTSNQ